MCTILVSFLPSTTLHLRKLHKEALLNFADTRYEGRKYTTVDHQQWKPPYYHWSWFRKIAFQFTLPWVPCIHEHLDFIDWRRITNLSQKKGERIWFSCCGYTRNNDVGRVPQNKSDHFWKFLSLPKTSVRVRVLGKKVNRGADYGTEIPVCFIFQGHVKGIA